MSNLKTVPERKSSGLAILRPSDIRARKQIILEVQVEKLFESIEIENYKSITKLKLDLGLVNVFIGENGAGKSNILEAIALAGAAEANKLDNEFLASRGIRVTTPQFMRSAFKADNLGDPIKITVATDSGVKPEYILTNDNKPYSNWTTLVDRGTASFEEFITNLGEYAKSIENPLERKKLITDVVRQLTKVTDPKSLKRSESNGKYNVKLKLLLDEDNAWRMRSKAKNLDDFIIFSPENSALRLFEREGQIEPLGINGEGLLKLLTVMSKSEDNSAFNSVKQSLKLFGWFDDFNIPDNNVRGQMEIWDGFIDESCAPFDQRSANEGFLFAAFYFALFASDLTPKFFAVDNIDASLNPKLCIAMIECLVGLAKIKEKQSILTTHNPAILDGLDLNDPMQRLFIVSRNQRGETKVRRFEKKTEGALPAKLSELFMQGLLGGLPKGF